MSPAVAAPSQVFLTNISTLLERREHEGKEYLVGPVVLATECVMNGLLYPADELKKFVEAWNDRVVPVFHPEDKQGKPLSANDPEIIANQTVGRLYNTFFDEAKKALKAEVWLDPDKVQEVSPRLAEILAGNGKVDVSTGLFLEVEPAEGQHKGKAYVGIARNYRPDHLALLPDAAGACTWAEGAGFPRVNKKQENEDMDKGRLRQLFRTAELLVQNEQSHSDLREALSVAIAEGRPNTQRIWVVDVFEKYVVYEVEDEATPGAEAVGAGTLFKQDYSVSSDDAVSLSGDAVEVVRKMSYEAVKAPVQNQEEEATEASAPSAVNDPDAGQGQSVQVNGEGGEGMADRQDRITALLANDRVSEEMRPQLEAMTDEQLTVFETVLATNEPEPEPEPEPVADPTPEEDPSPEEDPVEEEAPTVNEWEEEGKRLFEEKKAKLVSRIMANKRNTFTKEDLSAMPFAQLEKLGQLAVVANYGGRDTSVPATPAANADQPPLGLPGLPQAKAS